MLPQEEVCRLGDNPGQQYEEQSFDLSNTFAFPRYENLYSTLHVGLDGAELSQEEVCRLGNIPGQQYGHGLSSTFVPCSISDLGLCNIKNNTPEENGYEVFGDAVYYSTFNPYQEMMGTFSGDVAVLPNITQREVSCSPHTSFNGSPFRVPPLIE